MGKQTKVSHHKVNVIATSRCLELLQEMARVMLLNKQIPQKFWGEAVNTSCHIGNRIFFRVGIKKTAYEIWNGKKPRVKYFRVFGSKCYILNGRENLRKFDAKSDEYFFFFGVFYY